MERSSNYTVLIKQDEDGIYVAKVLDIPGCYSQGKSVEEAMKKVKEAIQVCIETEISYEPLKFVGIRQVEFPHND